MSSAISCDLESSCVFVCVCVCGCVRISVAPHAVFTMQHVNQGTGKSEKKAPHYEDASNNQIDNMFKQHEYECGMPPPTPVPQTSMLARIGLTAQHNIDLTGSGAVIHWCNRFGSEARGAFFSLLPVSAFAFQCFLQHRPDMQAVVMPYRCVCTRVCIPCRVDAWYRETHDNLGNLWKPTWKPLQNKRKPENRLILKLQWIFFIF